ncbi:hypothetical protein D9M68_979430 [compost metagenome]
MVTGSVRLAEADEAYRLSTLRPPALPVPGVTITGLAAASRSGAPMATCRLRAAASNGRSRKRSPMAAAPASTLKVRPSTTAGSAGTGVLVPSDRRTTLIPPASKRSS